MTDKDQQAKDAAKASEDAAKVAQASETIEGGRYLDTNGKTLVNANGEPVKGKQG